MAKKSFKPYTSALSRISIPIQTMHIQASFPTFKCISNRGAYETMWRGYLQPRHDTPRYQILVRYKPTYAPTVWVEAPALVAGAPHRYKEGNLCLYYPDDWTWKSDKHLIAATILPWTAIWLFYYELWLDTGKWLGPEAPHGPNPKKPEE